MPEYILVTVETHEEITRCIAKTKRQAESKFRLTEGVSRNGYRSKDMYQAIIASRYKPLDDQHFDLNAK